MRIIMLGSGSKGNATIIDFNEFQIMIDMGLTFKTFEERISLINYELTNLKYLFVTHEHVDHCAGIKKIINKYKCNLAYSEGTKIGMLKKNYINTTFCENDCCLKCFEEFKIKDLSVIAFPISHDVIEPYGYIFLYKNKKIVYLTDTGFVSENLYPLLKGADCYIIEANHDPELLLLSERPFYLKKRILSDEGHLSNLDSSLALCNLIDENTKEVILAHLSLECNTPQICLDTYIETFKHFNIDYTKFNLRVADQFNPIEVDL